MLICKSKCNKLLVVAFIDFQKAFEPAKLETILSSLNDCRVHINFQQSLNCTKTLLLSK